MLKTRHTGDVGTKINIAQTHIETEMKNNKLRLSLADYM